MTWRKPWLSQRPRYHSKALCKRIPLELSVRVVRFTLAVPGSRARSVTLVSTLLDAQLYPAQELARLYGPIPAMGSIG